MKFLRKSNIDKTIIVISDIHLGAGVYVNGKRNYLEDFHHDKELVEFLSFYSVSKEYKDREVELIINGDLFDLLAVPFVKYFDDEYWSEDAAMEKLKIILDAHPEVMEGFIDFLSLENKKITYIIGNHDAELIFDSLRAHLKDMFPEKARDRFSFRFLSEGDYWPVEGVLLRHGHEYELAHQFDEGNLVLGEDGKNYFIPPWGSYYVTRVINKFKEERSYINAVRPIRKFLINGLIYDPLFTLRFILANVYYFIMVRFTFFMGSSKNLGSVIKKMMKELELFQNYEWLTRKTFAKYPETKVLIVGHTHEPILQSFADGGVFINTGTWTKMHHLDFGKNLGDGYLTYAQIDIKNEKSKNKEKEKSLNANLHYWRGYQTMPYDDFN